VAFRFRGEGRRVVHDCSRVQVLHFFAHRSLPGVEMYSEECVVSSVLLGLDLSSVTGQGGSFFSLAYDPTCCGNGPLSFVDCHEDIFVPCFMMTAPDGGGSCVFQYQAAVALGVTPHGTSP
jgi:hypothetical protein